jgi:hypothetical protein
VEVCRKHGLRTAAFYKLKLKDGGPNARRATEPSAKNFRQQRTQIVFGVGCLN